MNSAGTRGPVWEGQRSGGSMWTQVGLMIIKPSCVDPCGPTTDDGYKKKYKYYKNMPTDNKYSATADSK